MASYGDRLKEARLKQGKTLEEVAAFTRIPAHFLEALEANKMEVIPGEFFRKSFLRQYASTVGLDPDEFKQDISISFGGAADADAPKLSSRLPEHPDLPPLPQAGASTSFPVRQVLLSTGLLVGVIAVCAVAYTFWEDFQSGERAAVEENTRQEPVPPPASSIEPQEGTTPGDAAEQSQMTTEGNAAGSEIPAPSAGEGSAAPTETPEPEPAKPAPAAENPAVAGTKPATAPETEASAGPRVHGSGPRELRLSATGSTWVQAKEGDRTVFVGVLSSGETRILRVNQGARLIVGNAGALSVTWEGKDLGTIGPLGQVRIVTVSPDEANVAPPQRATPAANSPGF